MSLIKMQQEIDIEEILIPELDIKEITLKKYDGKGIRLYVWGDKVRCDFNGDVYLTSLKHLKLLLYGKVKYCYIGEWDTEQEMKEYAKKKDVEFNERVKRSLRS